MQLAGLREARPPMRVGLRVAAVEEFNCEVAGWARS
jgi:hypothetical protein